MFVTFVGIVDDLLGSDLPEEVVSQFINSDEFGIYQEVAGDPDSASDDLRAQFVSIVDAQLGNMSEESVNLRCLARFRDLQFCSNTLPSLIIFKFSIKTMDVKQWDYSTKQMMQVPKRKKTSSKSHCKGQPVVKAAAKAKPVAKAVAKAKPAEQVIAQPVAAKPARKAAKVKKQAKACPMGYLRTEIASANARRIACLSISLLISVQYSCFCSQLRYSMRLQQFSLSLL